MGLERYRDKYFSATKEKGDSTNAITGAIGVGASGYLGYQGAKGLGTHLSDREIRRRLIEKAEGAVKSGTAQKLKDGSFKGKGLPKMTEKGIKKLAAGNKFTKAAAVAGGIGASLAAAKSVSAGKKSTMVRKLEEDRNYSERDPRGNDYERTRLSDIGSHKGIGRTAVLSGFNPGTMAAGFVGKKAANDADRQGLSDNEIRDKATTSAAAYGAAAGLGTKLIRNARKGKANTAKGMIASTAIGAGAAYLGAKKNTDKRLNKRAKIDKKKKINRVLDRLDQIGD